MSTPAARTGDAAVQVALGRVGGSMPASGYCLQFTREPFAIPAYYASAIDAWNGANHPHPDDRNPPAAVPVWFWSSSIYRHVAFHVGGGQIVTTFNSEIRSYPSISAMESIFGPYMGWAYDDLNEHNVTPSGAPPIDPGDDMPTPADLWNAAPPSAVSMTGPLIMSFVGVDGLWMCDLANLTRVHIPDPGVLGFLASIGVRRIENQPLGHLFLDITNSRA